MILHVIESDSGDELGVLNTDAEDDDLLEILYHRGYLEHEPEEYDISRSYEFADNHMVVMDVETGDPVLILESDEDVTADADFDDTQTEDDDNDEIESSESP